MRRILAYAALALGLGACGFGPLLSGDGTKPVDLAPSDLVGVWTGSLGDTIVEYRRCTGDCPSIAPQRPSLGVPAAAKPEQLTGVWRDQHGARLMLHPDGSFAADDLRFAYIAATIMLPNGAADLRQPLPGTGTWSTDSAESDPAGPHTVLALRITAAAGHSGLGVRGLTIYQDGKGLLLTTFTSNPDVIEQHVYRKATP